ncbi:cell division protein ZapE [Arhodomonas aquaeolei]|uniref:cell division protein ZapE n=1 Tax=Arhodomonas aquaeolei TaxID=2369 RepID=UPI0021670A0F|nr:cell division protein ZapE [Arhodomonas aquaeolei]MCS4502988.1 cell division protein ZapE [Arhodomonas aquaeolei]
MGSPRARYEQALRRDDFVHDPAQARAVDALEGLYQRLCAAGPRPEPAGGGLGGLWRRLRGAPETVEPETGVYLWGSVGRGKTWLMDIFYESLPFEARRRLHFHRFMRAVHTRLKTLKERQDPLDIIAEEWAADTRVLCFDEFFVSDIADAMLLAGLLQGLFRRGVTLVATSNIPPHELYWDGLQRERFVPAIELLERHTEVIPVDGDTDYRLRFLEQAEIYHTPLDAEADAVLTRDFDHVRPDGGEVTDETVLEVEGREIPVRCVADGVVWFAFDAVCRGPRSQNDYIEIARQFHTVVISDIPVFDRDSEDDARRFINLVDEFYDRGVKLICSAADEPDSLYRGHRLGFEFERTASRLTEMQSRSYLALPHRP